MKKQVLWNQDISKEIIKEHISNFVSGVIVKIPENINFDNQHAHTVNTLELNYKIRRSK